MAWARFKTRTPRTGACASEYWGFLVTEGPARIRTTVLDTRQPFSSLRVALSQRRLAARPDMKKAASSLSPRQYACLSALVVYTSGLSFLMHASRSDKHAAYLVSTSVFLAEIIKFAISFMMEYSSLKWHNSSIRLLDSDAAERGVMSPTLEEKLEQDIVRGVAYTPLSTLRVVLRLVVSHDCWKLGIPAILYFLQNMLQLLATGTISPATYQSLTQVKILTASLLSAWLLKQRYTVRQWLSVCALCVGVAILSTSKLNKKVLHSSIRGYDNSSLLSHSSLPGQHSTLQLVRDESAQLLGVLSVLLACTFGSGGAVVMEMVIKDNRASIWIRNAQLAIFSMAASGCAIAYDTYRQGQFDPMRHFGLFAWSVVLARSLAGFLIAYVLQQCDAVLKGIATCLAMILSLLVETYILGHNTPLESVIGAALVVFSSITYVRYQA